MRDLSEAVQVAADRVPLCHQQLRLSDLVPYDAGRMQTWRVARGEARGILSR